MSLVIDETSGAPGRLVLPAGVSLSNTLMSPLKEKMVYAINHLITLCSVELIRVILVSLLLILELILLNFTELITYLYTLIVGL